MLSEYRVHLAELEGHGDTPIARASYAIDEFAANIASFMREKGIERACVFGYSLGGYVALKLASASPELVDSVVTLGTKIAWTPEISAGEMRKCDPAKMRAKVPAFADRLEQLHRGTTGGWEGVLARTAALMKELGDRPVVDSTLLASIQQPVRMMVGDRDEFVTIDETAAAVKTLQRGELAVLPGTPHIFEQIRISLVASSIADFAISSRSR